jgi:hypothetical protein
VKRLKGIYRRETLAFRPPHPAWPRVAIRQTSEKYGLLMPSIKAEQLTDCAIRKARWPIGNLMTVVIIAAFLAMDRSRVCLSPTIGPAHGPAY